MSSVYTNDLRLEEIGSGEQSGTWGDTTNTNLELIAEAFSFGTEAITTNADTHTTTIADGSTDPGRSIYLKYTGTLDSACTITLGPNTVSKVWFIENATSGSQNIIISQGSGANVTIGNGAVKMVYSDGAGSGAAVVDALVDLDLTGTTTVAAANISGALQVDGAITSSSGATITVADNSDTLTLISTDTDASKGPNLVLKRDNNSGAGDDLLGTIDFIGEDAGNNLTSYVTMSTMIQDVTGGSEDGRFQLKLQSGGTSRNILDITGSNVIHFNSDGEDINFRYDSDTVANALFVDGATGYVSTGTLGSNNVRLGANAGDAIQSGGNYNVLIGDEAGTAITTGDYNVALGYNSLKTEDTGNRNTAIGYETLEDLNYDGDGYNTAVGFLAGNKVSTGIENTLIGGLAGDALTDADFNIAIGVESLGSDTKGNKSIAIGGGALNAQNLTTSTDTFNVAIGFHAGNDITTGLANTIVGGLAGDALTTGSDNVAMGYGALTTDDVGSRSIAIGSGALEAQNFATATNSYNTAVGHHAGNDVTTGTNNALIGALAGDALTTGNYNVALGTQALSADTLGSRSTAIGMNALAAQNFTTATDVYNVAVGQGAGGSVSTGKFHTLIGGLAGAAVSTGDENTGIGYQALGSEDSGGANVAVGQYAMGGTGNDSSGVTAVGHAAAYDLHPASDTTTYNVAVGYQALYDATTVISTTAIGGQALHSLETGNYNTAVGYQAAEETTVGDYITAVGTYALRENVVGDRSTAVGYGALLESNPASNMDMYNVAVGMHAGYNISTGNLNTSIGSESMVGNSGAKTTGSGNTVVGYLAGANIQGSGYQNTLMGRSAGDTISYGHQNVAIGDYALQSEGYGRWTTAVGTHALYSQNSDGSVTTNYNTAIGGYSGFNSDGYNCTFLGGLAAYEAAAADNVIAIGYESLRSGSPGGQVTTTSNIIGLGDENITSFNCQVSLTVASDERDKTDFTSLDLGMNFVKALKPYTFRWDKRINYADKSNDNWRSSLDLDKLSNDGTHKEDQLDIGFKAQDVKSLEEASNYKLSDKTNLTVALSEDGKQYSMRYEKLVPILVKAIQELEARVATLEGA